MRLIDERCDVNDAKCIKPDHARQLSAIHPIPSSPPLLISCLLDQLGTMKLSVLVALPLVSAVSRSESPSFRDFG